MNQVIAGMLVMGYLVAGLFFLRYWRRSRDALFAFFAIAMWLLAAQRLALAVTNENLETSTIFYTIRLAAFLLIIAGVLMKNRTSSV